LTETINNLFKKKNFNRNTINNLVNKLKKEENRIINDDKKTLVIMLKEDLKERGFVMLHITEITFFNVIIIHVTRSTNRFNLSFFNIALISNYRQKSTHFLV